MPCTSCRQPKTAHLLALNRVLGRWEGTPYRSGQRIRGMAVDCVQLVAGVLDDLFGRPCGATPVPRLKPDSAIHSPGSAIPTVRALVKGFGAVRVNGSPRPGDILVVRATTFENVGPRRPGHTMIVGALRGQLLHALPPQVCFTSLCDPSSILRIYRTDPKEWQT